MWRADLTLITFLSCASAVHAAEAPCEEPEIGTPAGSISYLKLSRSQQSDPCVLAALEILSGPGRSPDPNLLIHYVTFVRPREGLHMITIDSVENLYPAVAALVRVGDRALPTLVAALNDEANPEEVDRNVLRAMKLILARDSAALLRVLIDEARAATREERKRLDDATALASLWCSDEEQSACSELLGEPSAIAP